MRMHHTRKTRQERQGRSTPTNVSLDAALVALSGRVRVRDGAPRTAESIVTELWHEVFATREGNGARSDPSDPSGLSGPSAGKVPAPAGSSAG